MAKRKFKNRGELEMAIINGTYNECTGSPAPGYTPVNESVAVQFAHDMCHYFIQVSEKAAEERYKNYNHILATDQ